MFDVNKAIKESHLPKATILRLEREVKRDYPGDLLLYELHLIRALRPVRRFSSRLTRLSPMKN